MFLSTLFFCFYAKIQRNGQLVNENQFLKKLYQFDVILIKIKCGDKIFVYFHLCSIQA